MTALSWLPLGGGAVGCVCLDLSVSIKRVSNTDGRHSLGPLLHFLVDHRRGWRVAALDVQLPKAVAALGNFRIVRVKVVQTLKLVQEFNAMAEWKGAVAVHGIQQGSNRDRRGAFCDKEVINHTELGQKASMFQDIMSHSQRKGSRDWNHMEEMPRNTKGGRRMDMPVQSSVREQAGALVSAMIARTHERKQASPGFHVKNKRVTW